MSNPRRGGEETFLCWLAFAEQLQIRGCTNGVYASLGIRGNFGIVGL